MPCVTTIMVIHNVLITVLPFAKDAAECPTPVYKCIDLVPCSASGHWLAVFLPIASDYRVQPRSWRRRRRIPFSFSQEGQDSIDVL